MSGSPITDAGLSASAGGITQSPISDCCAGARPEEVRRPPDGDLDAPGVVGGHQVAGHRGADAALAGVGVVGAVLGERPSVGAPVHVDVVHRDQARAGGLGGGDRRRLQAGELLRPAVIRRVQCLVDDASAARRRRREGGIADVAGDGLNARHRLAQPGAVDDAHRLAAAGQRLGDGHPDGAGAEHDMVDGVHHAAGARAGVKRASRRPLSSVNSSAPPAPNTVNWSSTPMPVTDATDQPSAKSTGIASAHGSASARRPCRARTSPWAAPSAAPLTRPIRASAPRSVS